jgi:hypothetical protein
MDLITQGLSIAGLIGIVASYQQKKKSTLIFFQLFGAGLFGIHYLLLGAYAGFLLNIIAVTRALVFYKEDLPKRVGNIWVWIFHGLCLVAYVLTFIVFNTEPSVTNLILEILPAIGMVCLSISFNMTGAKEIRRLGTVSSVCWLIYNFAHLSIGGIACEGMCMVSIIVGILRHDRKEK